MKATERLLTALMRVPVPWVFVLAYLAGAGLDRLLPRAGRDSAFWAAGRIAGVALFVAGTALAVWCLTLFRRAGTTTVPGKTSAMLVTSGPYRWSRNPMYVALVLAYLGEAGILSQIVPLLLLPLVVAYLNGIVIRVEEARLSEAFDARYDAYRAEVSRWL
jgi:protein-S-isoprenylcysteine O-methyltransferase Ste14